MRPLNRPMFRYGGPIKEGVMSGIREPHVGGGRIGFKDGPKKKIFGIEIPGTGMAYDPATNQPYNPKYVQEMLKKERDKMTNVMSWMFPAMRGVKGAGYSYKLGMPAIKKLFQGPVSKSKELTKYAGPVTRGSDKWFGNIFRPAYQGVKQGAKDALAPLKNFKTAIGLGIPVGGYGLAKGYEAWKKRQTPGAPDLDGTKEITEKTTEKIVPEVPQKSNEEIRAERIQKYRDIMDIKGMNSEAAAKSLIEASRLINESQDFKGDIRSGSLINKIIQGASKAYDKPADMKRAIDTLIVKSETQHDLNKEDKALANKVKRKQIEALDREAKEDSLQGDMKAHY